MKYEYHTLFLSAPRAQPKKYMGQNEYKIDGVQLARDLQATIEKMSEQGFELYQTIPITSTAYLQVTYTEGLTVVFRKNLN